MNRIHALAAVLVTLPLAAHAETDWWKDAATTSEVTYSGGARQSLLASMLPEIGVTNVMNESKVIQIAIAGMPPLPMGIGGGFSVAGSVLGGLNFRLAGTAHQDVTLDGRLLGGVGFSYQPSGFFNAPFIGPAGGGELAVTSWLTPDTGLTLAFSGGLMLGWFVFPIPMARATVGLTF